LNPKDAEAYFALANGCFAVQQLDAAAVACRQALELNPNLAIAEGRLAHVLSFQGEYEQAIVHAERAYRLSPLDPFYSWWGPAKMIAAFGAGDYEEAAESARKAIRLKPEFPPYWRNLAASLAQLDRIEEARAATDRLLQLLPHESLRLVRSRLTSVNADFLERFIEGLRKAGVPE
jgi:tetratricopeptide (TPR) repeat protein